jgi:hypothetical protein
LASSDDDTSMRTDALVDIKQKHIQQTTSPSKDVGPTHAVIVTTKDCSPTISPDKLWQVWNAVPFPHSKESLLKYIGSVISGLFTLAPSTYIDIHILTAEYWTTFHEHAHWPVVLLPPDWVTNGYSNHQFEALKNALGSSVKGKNHFGAIVFGESHFWFVHGNKTDVHVLGDVPSPVQYQQYKWQDYIQGNRVRKDKTRSKVAHQSWILAKLLFEWNDVAHPENVHLRSWRQNGTDCALHAVYMAMACMTSPMKASSIDIDTQSPLLCSRHGRARLLEYTATTIHLVLFHFGQIQRNLRTVNRGMDREKHPKLRPLANMMTTSESKADTHELWKYISQEIILTIRSKLNNNALCTCTSTDDLLDPILVRSSHCLFVSRIPDCTLSDNDCIIFRHISTIKRTVLLLSNLTWHQS